MDSFLNKLARAQPDPGGGAAAAFGARLGLALLEKVVRLERRRRPSPGKPPPGWEEVLARLRQMKATLQELQEEDVRAYLSLAAARASGDLGRLAAALPEALDCPGRIAEQAAEALKLLAWAGERCRRHLLSDLLVGCEFLGAAFRGAQHIARANLPLVQEDGPRQSLARELDQARRQGEDLYRRVKKGLLKRVRGSSGSRILS